MFSSFLSPACLLLLLACGAPESSGNQFTAQFTAQREADFNAYWYAGQAEISRYQLQQAQYGALHPGEAVLIFVTEDFLVDQQVKLESARTDAATPVLKLNAIRRFITGIYDYSLFTSVFTPVDTRKFPHTLKVTTSGQDWCGQTYAQLNFRNNQFQITAHSYFQQEADEAYTAEPALLEDEIWTRIRLNPEKLPTGNLSIIPGTGTARLRHQRLRAEAARATLETYSGNDFSAETADRKLNVYTLVYPGSKRTLSIVFERSFPHRIAGWEEQYESKGQLLTSRARRTGTLLTDYWSKNSPADSTLRNELGVQMGLKK